MFIFVHLFFGLMDVSADHIIVIIFYGKFSSGLFKVINVLNGALNAIFYFFGQGIFLSAHFGQAPIQETIDQNKKVVAISTELGQPLGVLDRDIEHVTMKNPSFFTIKI